MRQKVKNSFVRLLNVTYTSKLDDTDITEAEYEHQTNITPSAVGMNLSARPFVEVLHAAHNT